MGRTKDMWMDWQEQVATPEQLELDIEEQLKLAHEWFMEKHEHSEER
jgi:hypothetical protein